MAPLIAVRPQRPPLDPVAQRVAQVLLAGVGSAVERERRLLVKVLELLFVQPAALREAAGDPQLHRLPLAEKLPYPL